MRGKKTVLQILSLILLGGFLGEVQAQSTVNTPYSRYGLGEGFRDVSPASFGMGGLSLPVVDYFQINTANPASYSFFRLPLLDVGVEGRMSLFKSETDEGYADNFSFRSVKLGLPVSRKFGAVLSITPYVNRGYSVSQDVPIIGLGNIKNTYEGSGGINRALAGVSYMMIDKDSVHVSAGVNLGYAFGTLFNIKKSNYSYYPGFKSTWVEENLTLKGLVADFGIQYEGIINEDLVAMAGFSYGFETNAKATRNMEAYSYLPVGNGNDIKYDEIESQEDEDGEVTLPFKFGSGLAFEVKNKWTLGAQFSSQEWSTYEERFNDTTSGQLTNLSEFIVGAQFIPHKIIKPDVPVWKSTHYRIGFRYSDTPLEVAGTRISEYGMSFGLSVPLARATSVSKFNLGVELGKRGALTNGLLQEDYINFRVGFSMSPNVKRDVWFRKRKYD